MISSFSFIKNCQIVFQNNYHFTFLPTMNERLTFIYYDAFIIFGKFPSISCLLRDADAVPSGEGRLRGILSATVHAGEECRQAANHRLCSTSVEEAVWGFFLVFAQNRMSRVRMTLFCGVSILSPGRTDLFWVFQKCAH